jgi:hypothetical protein
LLLRLRVLLCKRCTWRFSPLNAGSRQQHQMKLLQVLDEFLFVASSSKCLVLKDHAEVSAVARAVATAILIITIRHLLSPRSFTRPPVVIPCGQLSALSGEGRAYHVPDQLQDRLGLVSTPVALGVHDAGYYNPHSGHVPFWSQRSSFLRCFFDNGVCTTIQIS